MAAASRSVGIERLQPGQVEDHHVARVPPAGEGEHGPEADLRIPEPVDHVSVQRIREEAADEPCLRREDQLRDQADDRRRDHDRDVEEALVDPRAADPLVELVGKEHPERRSHEREGAEPVEVVPERRPERRVDGRDLAVVRRPGPVDRLQAADPVPAREREADRRDGREPDQRTRDDHGDPDHERHRDTVAGREAGGALPLARAARSHGRCDVGRHRAAKANSRRRRSPSSASRCSGRA